MNQIERILALIKIYKNDIDPVIAKLDIETLIDKIKLYCNISELPTTLERPIARELFKIYNTAVQGITSFKEGDTTITYAKPVDFDNAMSNIKQTLFAYRRIYKVVQNV